MATTVPSTTTGADLSPRMGRTLALLSAAVLAFTAGCDGSGDDQVFSIDDPLGRVDATIFADLDRSRSMSGGDRPFEDLRVGLRRSGTVDTVTLKRTSPSGEVTFGDLAGGTYDIVIDLEPFGDSLVKSFQNPDPLVVERRSENPVLVGFSYPIVSLAEARESSQDRRIFVEGVALNAAGALPGNALHVWADGNWIRAENTSGAGVSVGDSVRVRGSVHREGGSVVLREGLRSRLPGANEPIGPVTVSTAQADGAQGGLDGALVRIESAQVMQTVFQGGTSVSRITDGSSPLMVHVPSGHLTGSGLPIPGSGSTVSLTGLLVAEAGGNSWILRTRSHDDVAITSTGTITGRVFIDQENSGEFDAGEDTPLGSVRVSVRASQIGGGTIGEAVTGSDGRFQITDLPTGAYQVELDPFSYPESLSIGSISPSPIPVRTNEQTAVTVPLRPPSDG